MEDDIIWKYYDLSSFLRYNAENLSFTVDAHNVTNFQDLFILFYKWINRDNTFLAAPNDEKTFEKFNIEAFQTFFTEHNPEWEKYWPPNKVLRDFFWDVVNKGYNKHYSYIKKKYPNLEL